MKPFPPTLREKRRYIAFQIISSEKFSKKDVEKAVTSNVFKTIGLFGAADSSYWLVQFHEDNQAGIIRTTNEYKDKIMAGFNFLTEIKEAEVKIKPLKTTGTIKKAEEAVKNLSQ